MKKYYELGSYVASIERTSSGYWLVTVKTEEDKEGNKYLFASEASALREILSYAEIEEDSTEEEETTQEIK